MFIAAEEKEKKVKSINPDNHLNYYQCLLNELRSHCGLPEIYRPIRCVCRKDTQVFTLLTSPSKWEQIKNRYMHITSVHQYTQFIMELTWEYLQPKLEEYYGAKISYSYLLGPHVEQKTVFAYCVQSFDTPLFKVVDPHLSNTEEKLASIISGYTRELNGKGPNRIKVSILDNRFIVVCFSGLIPKYMKEYVSINTNVCLYAKQMIVSLVNCAVDYAFQSEYRFIPEKFTEVDFKQDHIVVLAITRPMADIL